MKKTKVGKKRYIDILNETLKSHPDYKLESGLEFLWAKGPGISSTFGISHNADEKKLMEDIQREVMLTYELDQGQK